MGGYNPYLKKDNVQLPSPSGDYQANPYLRKPKQSADENSVSLGLKAYRESEHGKRDQMRENVYRNLQKTDVLRGDVTSGVEDLPTATDPNAVQKLASPPWYKKVIPWLGKTAAETAKNDLATVGQVLNALDQYLPIMRPLRGAIYEQAKVLGKSFTQPGYKPSTSEVFGAIPRGIYNAYAGKDQYLGEELVKEFAPKLAKVKLLPTFGAGMALGSSSDSGLAEVMYPDLAKAKADERTALEKSMQEGIEGKGIGPTLGQGIGMAADLLLAHKASTDLPKPISIGRREVRLGTPVDVVTPESQYAADLANASRLLKRQGVVPGRQANLEELRKTFSPDVMAKYTNRAADLAYQEATNPLPGIRKFRPTNTAQRQLDEIMQRAKRAPIDTEASITNTRQAREYLRGVFDATPEEVAALSDAEATRLATEAQQAKTLPTALERVQREATASGANLDDLFKQASESPMDRMRRLSERARLSRVAGVSEAPQSVQNPFTQPETTPIRPVESVTHGLEVFGKEVVTPKQVLKGLDTLSQATGVKALGNTQFGQKVISSVNKTNQAFNRRYVPAGAPKSVAEIPSVLDRQGDLMHNAEKQIIERLKPTIAEISPSNAELELMYHIRDLGVPFTMEGATEAASKGLLNPSILQSMTEARLGQLAKVDAAFQHEYGRVLAPMQKEAGINLTERPNYVTHLVKVNEEAANAFDRAFPNQTSLLRSVLSGSNRFTQQRKLATLAQAKLINKMATDKGLAAPFIIESENYLDAFSRYTQSALRAVQNRNVFKDIAARHPELIKYAEESPGRGWVSANNIAGMQEALGGDVKAWLHPAAAEKLSDELVRLNSLGGAGKALGGFFSGLDKLSNLYRGSYTAYRFPKFQLRNLSDNTVKRWMFDALGFDAEASAILKGGSDVVTLPKPMQIRDFSLVNGKWKYSPGTVSEIKSASADQWKELFTVSGLTETGQFGRRGDIATTIRHELGKGKLGKLADLPKEVGRVTEDASKVALALSRGQAIGDIGAGVQEANRVLFRYSDLTPFERDVLKPLAGFYTFQRKNIPLMSKALLERPEKFAQLGLASSGLKDKRVDESTLPEYQRTEFSVPIALPNGETYVFNPGISVGDAFKVLPHRWPENVVNTINPVLMNTLLTTVGVDRYGNKLVDMPPKEPPGWLPDSVAAHLPGAITTTQDGEQRVRIPGGVRYVLDLAAGGAPKEIATLMESDEPDNTKADKLQKILFSSFGRSYSMDELQNRQLRTAERASQGALKRLEDATGKKVDLDKIKKLQAPPKVKQANPYLNH